MEIKESSEPSFASADEARQSALPHVENEKPSSVSSAGSAPDDEPRDELALETAPTRRLEAWQLIRELVSDEKSIASVICKVRAALAVSNGNLCRFLTK